MNPLVEKLGSFLFWVAAFYVALLIAVVPAWNQGEYALAGMGLAVVIMIFIVVPVVARVVCAIRKARGDRPQMSSRP
jgi:hypothetical protein